MENDDKEFLEEEIQDEEVEESSEEQSTESTDEEQEESSEEEKKELTPAQQFGALRRKMTKLEKSHPELLQKEDKPKEKKEKSQDDKPLTRQESYLISKGVDLEGLDKLNKIAAINEQDILEAYESEEYAIYKEAEEKRAKQRASQLEATRGGSRAKQGKTLDTPGLTREEHMALIEKNRQKRLQGK